MRYVDTFEELTAGCHLRRRLATAVKVAFAVETQSQQCQSRRHAGVGCGFLSRSVWVQPSPRVGSGGASPPQSARQAQVTTATTTASNADMERWYSAQSNTSFHSAPSQVANLCYWWRGGAHVRTCSSCCCSFGPPHRSCCTAAQSGPAKDHKRTSEGLQAAQQPLKMLGPAECPKRQNFRVLHLILAQTWAQQVLPFDFIARSNPVLGDGDSLALFSRT